VRSTGKAKACLQNSDIRGPGKDDFYIQEPGNRGPEPSKGRFEISWIWLVPRSVTEVEADSSEQVLDEGMRIERSKSQGEQLYIMSGRLPGGFRRTFKIRQSMIRLGMELQPMLKSKHIIASVWLKALRVLGCLTCNLKEQFQNGDTPVLAISSFYIPTAHPCLLVPNQLALKQPLPLILLPCLRLLDLLLDRLVALELLLLLTTSATGSRVSLTKPTTTARPSRTA
jgi:hypothetical protein